MNTTLSSRKPSRRLRCAAIDDFAHLRVTGLTATKAAA